MTAAITTLVARGEEDLYIIGDAQITFFKVAYRRHTNFAYEPTIRHFSQEKPDFGDKVSCIISNEGDLVNGVAVVVTIPKINSMVGDHSYVDSQGLQTSKYNRFAWVKRLGYVIIKKAEIDINGKLIDCQYGEWMSLWNELVGRKDRGHDKNIGNVPELYDFTESKDEYTMRIPLDFWFCRNSGSALPLIALKYSDVKVNVEFADVESCYVVTPSHYITCDNDLTNFSKYEYIEQTIGDGKKRAGLFVDYDIINKRLYYLKLTKEKLLGIEYDGDASELSQAQIDALIASSTSTKYQITGKTSRFVATPYVGVNSKSNYIASLEYIAIQEAQLLVNYVFLDEYERLKMAKTKHDYLVEQVYRTPSTRIDGTNARVNIHVDHPCRFIIWMLQMDDCLVSNDTFNYTNSLERERNVSAIGEVTIGDTLGEDIVKMQTIHFNDHERISWRSPEYFTWCQTYQHFKYEPPTGVNIYSHSLFPYKIQPSGACNMRLINSVNIKMKLKSDINVNNPVKFRSYQRGSNILRIVGGLAALLFD